MSDRSAATAPTEPVARPRPPMRGGFGGGPFGGAGMPAEKPMRFGPSVRRLLARLKPEGMRLAAVIGLGITSVTFLVIGPKIRSEERRVGKECRSRWSPYH